MIFQNEKTSFQAIETRISKYRKNVIFRKWLTHGFGLKMAVFSNFFFFGQYRPGQSLLRYSRTKNAFLGYKNKMFKKWKNCIFSKGLTHGFLSKMAIFPTFFFQVIQARKMSFMVFSKEKTPFQALKTGSSKCRKIGIFPKELIHGFGPKMAIVPTFFFRQYSIGKCLL